MHRCVILYAHLCIAVVVNACLYMSLGVVKNVLMSVVEVAGNVSGFFFFLERVRK